jgi:hypothetical protein
MPCCRHDTLWASRVRDSIVSGHSVLETLSSHRECLTCHLLFKDVVLAGLSEKMTYMGILLSTYSTTLVSLRYNDIPLNRWSNFQHK